METYDGGNNETLFLFTSSDEIRYVLYLGAAYIGVKVTTQLFRDPSAWYHIIVVLDTTNATAANRMLIYVNGVQVTVFSSSTDPAQNTNGWINNTSQHRIGNDYSSTLPFDGEMAEVNFVDGQALLPASFGASSIYNQWLPVKYTGTYGTNGFYLPFSNTTSTSTLVADSSGNGNNWTPNNISLTAGSTYDSLTDVPTLTSATAANYAVLNPLTKTGSAVVIQDANLTFTKSGAAYYNYVSGTIGVSSGKFYWEITQGSTTDLVVGITNSFYADANNGPGFSANAYVYLSFNGNKKNNSSSVAYGATFQVLNDVVGIALDMDAGTLTFYKNGVSQGQAYSGLTGVYFPYVSDAGGQITLAYANFGQRPFTYTPPTGFLALNTYNIPAGTVTTSGTFTGNLSTDGPFVFLNGTPTTMTINGNAVTFGTQADKLANGFKVRSSSASYNASGSNTYTASVVGAVFKYEDAQSNP
jgi:hypothetical protein